MSYCLTKNSVMAMDLGHEQLLGNRNPLSDESIQVDLGEHPWVIRQKALIGGKNPNEVRKALILNAIESTIKEKDAKFTPVACFGVLLSLIEQNSNKEGVENDIMFEIKFLFIVLQKLPSSIAIAKGDILVNLLGILIEKFKSNQNMLKMVLKVSTCWLSKVGIRRWNPNSLHIAFFGKILSMCAYEEDLVSREAKVYVFEVLRLQEMQREMSTFGKTVMEWWSNNLSVIIRIMNENFKDNAQNIFKAMEFLAELCSHFISSEYAPLAEKNINNTVNTFKEIFLLLENDPKLSYSLISIVQKMLIPFDANGKSRESCIIYSIYLRKIIDTFEIISGQNKYAEVTMSIIQRMAQVLSPFSHVFRLLDIKDSSKITDPKLAQAFNSYEDVLLRAFKTCMNGIAASKKQVASKDIVAKTTCSASKILHNCFDKNLVNDSGQKLLDGIFDIIRNHFNNYHYKESWIDALEILSTALETLGNINPAKTASFVCNIPLLWISRDSDEMALMKNKIDYCLVLVINNTGWNTFFQTLINENQLYKVSNMHDLTQCPQLLDIYSKALSLSIKHQELDNKSAQSVHMFGDYFTNLLPTMFSLLDRLNSIDNQIGLEERMNAESLCLKIWEILPKLCSCLPKDICEWYGEIEKHVIPYINEPNRQTPFHNTRYSTLYVKISHKVYASILKSRVSYLNASVKEDFQAILDKYDLVIRNLEDLMPTLCNNFIETYSVMNMDPTQRNIISQNLNEYRHSMIGEVIRWGAPLIQMSSYCSYLRLLLKSILDISSDDSDFIRLYLMMDLVVILLSSSNMRQILRSGDKEEMNSIIELSFSLAIKYLTYDDISIQKLVYKLLNGILDVVNPENVEKLYHTLMSDPILNGMKNGCRKNRINLLFKIVASVSDEFIEESYRQIMPELLLTAKDSNSKTRSSAYSALLAISRKVIHYSNEGDLSKIVMYEKFKKFIYVIASGLASSQVMQAASAVGVAYLIAEYKELVEEDLITEIFLTISELNKSESNELLKAYLVSVRIIVSCVDPEKIDHLLELIVSGLLSVSRRKGHKLRYITLHILTKLTRKFSYKKIEKFVPAEDRKFFSNIQKKNSKEKDIEHNDAATNLKSMLTVKKEVLTDRTSIKNKKKIVADSHYSSDDDTTFTVKKQKGNNILGKSDEIFDLLDIGTTGGFAKARERVESVPKKSIKKEYFDRDSTGKFIIRESDEEDYGNHNKTNDTMETSTDSGNDEKSTSKSIKTCKSSQTLKSSKSSKEKTKRKALGYTDKTWGCHTTKSTVSKVLERRRQARKILGRDYKNNKSRGDVKKSGAHEPYAYIPLSSKLIRGLKKNIKNI